MRFVRAPLRALFSAAVLVLRCTVPAVVALDAKHAHLGKSDTNQLVALLKLPWIWCPA